MKTKSLFISLLIIFVLFSCSHKEEQTLITKKIQYDVTITNTNPDYDPWIENIIPAKRTAFVQEIMDAAYSGKINVYDYFNNPISAAELQNLGVDTTYRTLTRTYPPYEEFDTVIVSRLNIRDINKIRFLEEWKMGETNFVFEKKVIGIAPVIDKFDSDGNFLGKQPLFWIYPEGKPE